MQKLYRIKLIAAMGVVVGGLLLTGCGKQEGPAQAGLPEVGVMVVRPERVTLTTELTGRTSAYLIAEVRPQVSGIIQKRLFAEGSDVKAGDVLYQIDPALYQAASDNGRAALARAEANLPPIRLKVERYKELVAVKAVSQQEYDDSVAALLQVEADIKYWKAIVETARINLEYTRITAPITGRIGKSNVTVGALVTANQGTALATIQQLDPTYVDVTQSIADLLRLKRNITSGRIKRDGANQARVKLILEDGTVYPLEGMLQFRDITVDPTTGSVTLRVVFPNPDGVLLPGMFVRAVVKEGINERAILIPQQAMARDPKGNPFTLIVDGEGKVRQRLLTLDRATGDQWLVSAGLASGDRVIVEGIQRVRPGAPVKVIASSSGRKEAAEPTNAAQPATKEK